MSGGHTQLSTVRDESSGARATSPAPVADMATAGTRAQCCGRWVVRAET
jgi:hypothetical protein